MSSTVEMVSHGLMARLVALMAARSSVEHMVPSDKDAASQSLLLALAGFDRLHDIARRPVRIAILGESNAGKTTLANRLIGSEVLPTSVVSNTPYDVWVRHAATPSVHASDAEGTRFDCSHDASSRPEDIRGLEIGLPFAVLRDIEIIDTCARRLAEGGNRPAMLPKADVLVWCTNAARAWGASERAARNSCPPLPPARAILVATHADTLRGPEARDAVRARLKQEAGKWFATVLFTGCAGTTAGSGGSLYSDVADGAEAASEDGFETVVLRTANQFRTRRERTLSRLAGRLARLSLDVSRSLPQGAETARLRSALEALLPAAQLAVTPPPLHRPQSPPQSAVRMD